MSRKLVTEEFILKARKVHGDRYDYSKTKYKNARTKVTITCPEHGDFEQRLYNHIQGQGCPKCGGSMRLTTEEFISRSKSLWGESTFNYSKCVYVNDRTKVTLICKKHNIEFVQSSYSHLLGRNACPECFYEKYGRHENGYWTYDRCYETARKYEWLIDFRRDDNNCYHISFRNNWLKDFTWLKRYYEEEEDILTAQKHCIYKYEFPDYNTVYIGLSINVKKRYITGHSKKGSVYNFCKANNIVIPIPQIIEDNLTLNDAKIKERYWIKHYKDLGYNLLNKTKGGDSVGVLYKVKTGNETTLFIEKAKLIHGEKYSYDKVEYKNNTTKVIITCPLHEDFEQIPSNHLKGHGCPKCYGGHRSNTEEFVVKSREVHGGKYDYSKVVYEKAKVKVIIVCPIHGDFKQTPHGHLGGKGCPKCGVIKCAKSITKWSYEACKVESKKYKSRNDFKKGSSGSYQACLKNKWLNDFFPKK